MDKYHYIHDYMSSFNSNDLVEAFFIYNPTHDSYYFSDHILIKEHTLFKLYQEKERTYLVVLSAHCDLYINNLKLALNVCCLYDQTDVIKLVVNGTTLLNQTSTCLKLPFAIPSVKTYPYFTAIMGILEAHNCARIWTYNNYLLLWMFKFIHFNEYWTDFKYGDEEHQKDFCSFLHKKIITREQQKDWDIIDFIYNALQKHQYILVSIDVMYLDDWWTDQENKQHFKHQVLVFGIDLPNDYVLISDFTANGTYRIFSVSLDLFKRAYCDINLDTRNYLKEFGNDIWLLKFNSSTDEQINLRRIRNLCFDALHSKDTYYKSYLWDEHTPSEIAYGMEFYDELLKALNEKRGAEIPSIDLRPFHLLVEYGKVMKERIHYLVEKHITTEELFSLAEQFHNNSFILRTLVIKLKMSKKECLFETIENYILKLQVINKALLIQLIDLCEKKYEKDDYRIDIATK